MQSSLSVGDDSPRTFCEELKIHLKDFTKTGRFGDVTLGMPKSDVIANLGDPDFDSRQGRTCTIAAYGRYELFFDGNDILYAIQNDHVDPAHPDFVEYSSERFEIDPWILRPTARETLSTTEAKLREAQIDFTVIDYFDRRAIQVRSGVILDFDDEGSDPKLIAIRYFAPEQAQNKALLDKP